jgi:hypothetical protein
MTFTLPHAVLFALALGAAPAFAQGPKQIEASNFSMLNDWAYEADTITSDANGVTRIRLNDAASELASTSNFYEGGNAYQGWFGLTLREGYRMTGFSLSGTLVGDLGVPVIPGGQPGNGVTENGIKFTLGASNAASGTSSNLMLQRTMIQGALPFVLASEALSMTGQVNMGLWSPLRVYSSPYYLGGHPDGGMGQEIRPLVSLRVLNPTLTIYTSAVPEPSTYGMLLAGVAVIGLVRRRRRAA